MNDQMNPLVQFSPLKGELVSVNVPGSGPLITEYENDMTTVTGLDRTMFAYAPVSGCPDPKQTQILFILRNDATKASAQTLLETLQLADLAEREHFLVLFPNPQENGWNYNNQPDQENDMDFLARCFSSLKSGSLKMSGFNGLLFYAAVDSESSAMLMTTAALCPSQVSAMFLRQLPSEYCVPEKALEIATAAWCSPGIAADHLKKWHKKCGDNPECRLFVADTELSASLLAEVWDQLFSVTRRWQNDTYGTYQIRTAFSSRGFIAHVNDSSLGVNQNFPHTWYEYIPEKVKNSATKAPLVFYFHGVNCVPLYGAEQSNWHDLADRDGFIVVYPAPAQNKAWNIYDLPQLPSDFAFILALIDHMKQNWNIDESRIYSTGFSMGGMMTHALTAAYPEIFAAGAPCNAFSFSRFQSPYQTLAPFLRMTEEELGTTSYSALMADKKKMQKPDRLMPIFQNAGADDGLIASWPYSEGTDDVRIKTLRYWKQYNNIPLEPEYSSDSFSGLSADTQALESGTTEEISLPSDDNRFFHQKWYPSGSQASAQDVPALLELVIAKRMPHAIVPVQIEMAWNYISHFSRGCCGELYWKSNNGKEIKV